MTSAKVRLAMAAMGQKETKVDALCEELGVTRQARHVPRQGKCARMGRNSRTRNSAIASDRPLKLVQSSLENGIAGTCPRAGISVSYSASGIIGSPAATSRRNMSVGTPSCARSASPSEIMLMACASARVSVPAGICPSRIPNSSLS